MLTVFTLILGYDLKIAIGTSTMIMALVALIGAVRHICMGTEIKPLPMVLVVLTCLFGAVTAAGFANKCDILKLNLVIGVVLLILGVFTVVTKFIIS